MKHLESITKSAPEKAAVWQDVICYSAHAVNIFVETKGGVSPFAAYLDDKCDLPIPND